MKPLKEYSLVRKLGNYFLGLNQWLWNRLPSSIINSRPIQQYGHLMHKLVLMRGWRQPNPGTYMLRNRAEMEMIHSLASQQPAGTPFRIVVLACSFGMEVYSFKWALRDLVDHTNIQLIGLDVDEAVLDIARSGCYPLTDFTWQFERLSPEEYSQICPTDGDSAKVSENLRSGIRWLHGDACAPELLEKIGQQDMVVANRFLCHMEPQQASRCLRAIARLVNTGGYLFVTGVDLAVRQRVMRELGFLPVAQSLEDIHNEDISLLNGWPWDCWGLEPFDNRRADWIERYAMVYQKPGAQA
jgi:SAM-dependent methyltransferase